jgi:CspA family cold shock protein
MGRKQGQVKFFDGDKGFGFIECDGVDYFVHVTNLRQGSSLIDGETVEFKPVQGRKQEGPEALNVERVDPPSMTRSEGTVERYNEDKGYGFISRGPGQGDVFVHTSDVEGSRDLCEGAKVTYTVRSDRDGRTRAYKVKLCDEET